MSYALSNYTSGKQKRKRLKKKMAITDSTGAKTSNVARRMASEVSITVADAQRENRQASQKWKAKSEEKSHSEPQ